MLCIQVVGAEKVASGDITDTHVLWEQKQGIGSKPSPVLVGDQLFCVSDDGILIRVESDSGEIAWKERLGGKFSSSLVANSEHLYAFDHGGKGYVYDVALEPERVAENQLESGCNASPAIVENSLIVRTTTHLYRIANDK
jgi:outer membrane protein assembly factor BamB